MKGIYKTLNLLEKKGLYPKFHLITEGVNEPLCTVNGKTYLMFSSNNYLSLTQNLSVKKAAKRAIDQYGVGPSGSRVISGNVDIIENLEREIADLTGTEDCLTFPTGYMANIAVFQALMDPFFLDYPAKSDEGVIFSDELNHGSIVDGCRLSRAKKVIFSHNSLIDLERKIKENNFPNKLIVTEGVFSLESEIINIPLYIELAKKYGAKLMIDDAHGVGILGTRGGGVAELFSRGKDIDILMGCMDKAFGGTGGYLCGDKQLIKYLRVTARSSLLSSAYPTMAAGAMIEAINQIKKGQKLREHLFQLAQYLRDRLVKLGFRCVGNDTLPAIPLEIGDERLGIKFSKLLFEAGIFCIVFRWPAVPLGESRLRITVMVNHTKAQLDQFIITCQRIGKHLRVI